MKLGIFHGAALLVAGTVTAATAIAQTGAAPAAAPTLPIESNLKIPANPQFFGDENPNIRKATAIVNGTVITGTDVDQRVALILMANQSQQVPPDQLQLLRQQVLRNIVDEVLQMQAATAKDIKIDEKDVDSYFARYAQTINQTPRQFTAYLRANGSSETAFKQQIRGEIAWSRLQHAQIEPFVNISEEEVKSVIERLNASRGTEEFKVSEIFLSATPENAAQVQANASRILEQLRGGAPFAQYARQFSEASTAAVGGDLGWVRAEQLPDALAAAVRGLPVGSVSQPIAIPGGFSISAVEDKRQVLTADPRDAVLSLKQVVLNFPANTPRAETEPKIKHLVEVTQHMGGCGGADAAAAKVGGEVITNDQYKVRDLPTPLQTALLGLSVGQATQPFGSAQDRVSVLVLCGRDDPPAAPAVSYDQIYNQLAEERVNMRARRYLRDLRRDAVIDYR
ncbi:MAG: peptidylprolyl isomerase [Alphaproteobacteria bacterium]|nr:peptidylprolyl isomerase [Alphaproteobacteria bacterium]